MSLGSMLKVQLSTDSLHIRTLVTHCLLSHLETTRSKLRRPHFLSAVTLPLARGFFGYRFVTDNLQDGTLFETLIMRSQMNQQGVHGMTSNSTTKFEKLNEIQFNKPQQSCQSTPLQV